MKFILIICLEVQPWNGKVIKDETRVVGDLEEDNRFLKKDVAPLNTLSNDIREELGDDSSNEGFREEFGVVAAFVDYFIRLSNLPV